MPFATVQINLKKISIEDGYDYETIMCNLTIEKEHAKILIARLKTAFGFEDLIKRDSNE